MCKLLIALVLLNARFSVNAGPIANNSISVYNTIKSYGIKCPYLQATVLKSEPDFLKPCTSFDRIQSIGSLNDENVNDVRCTIYYNYFVLLCFTGNLTQEEVASYFDKEKVEAALKSNTVGSACKTLQSDDHVMETVNKSMSTIFSHLKVGICQKICSDFSSNLYAACNEAAYMVQVRKMHIESVQNANKSKANIPPAPQTRQHETPAQTAQTEQVQEDKAQTKTSNKTPEITNKQPNFEIAPQQIPAPLKPDVQVQDKTVFKKVNSIQEAQETKPVDSVPETKLSDNNKSVETEKVKGDLNIESNEVKPKAETSPEKKDEVKAGVESKQVEVEKSEPTAEKTQLTPEKNEAAPEKGKVTPEKTDIAPEKSQEAPPKKVAPEESKPLPPSNTEPEKGDIDISGKQEPKLTSGLEADNPFLDGREDEDIGRDEYEGDDEQKQMEEQKEAEIPKPPTESNKQPEGKHKTPKPEETVEDDVLLSASYNQHIDEDDSYFFSYFMMVCVVFILAYVAYHNKQKVFALVLEGRRGRRSSRSRRPNSANYHKLDSNLEEAVSSSCNKNQTHIIY